MGWRTATGTELAAYVACWVLGWRWTWLTISDRRMVSLVPPGHLPDLPAEWVPVAVDNVSWWPTPDLRHQCWDYWLCTVGIAHCDWRTAGAACNGMSSLGFARRCHPRWQPVPHPKPIVPSGHVWEFFRARTPDADRRRIFSAATPPEEPVAICRAALAAWALDIPEEVPA